MSLCFGGGLGGPSGLGGGLGGGIDSGELGPGLGLCGLGGGDSDLEKVGSEGREFGLFPQAFGLVETAGGCFNLGSLFLPGERGFLFPALRVVAAGRLVTCEHRVPSHKSAS